jgi:hypothetical protein
MSTVWLASDSLLRTFADWCIDSRVVIKRVTVQYQGSIRATRKQITEDSKTARKQGSKEAERDQYLL